MDQNSFLADLYTAFIWFVLIVGFVMCSVVGGQWLISMYFLGK